MNKKLLFVVFIFNFLYSMQAPKLGKLAYGYCLQENGKVSKREKGNSSEWRQEDTVSCVQEANGDLFVSLFDGHGGDAISTFLKKEMYSYFDQTAFAEGNINTKDRLISAFQKADSNTPRKMEDDFDMYGIQGSTALVGYFKKNVL